MSTALFFPPAKYVPNLKLKAAVSLGRLCQLADVKCQASGVWTERQIEVLLGTSLKIIAEPGDWGAVQIELPERYAQTKAREALAVLAYGMHDLVAKQSISGASWNKPAIPPGRKKSGRALTGAERQKRFRERQSENRR